MFLDKVQGLRTFCESSLRDLNRLFRVAINDGFIELF
jgi:hypothetical protein